MATLVSVTKEKGLLSFLYDDGSVLKRTIRYDDAMISNPPPGYEEVGNCYINSAGKLVINYNGSSTTIDPTGGSPFDEILLTPKASSSGARGTIFFADHDDHLYVGTE